MKTSLLRALALFSIISLASPFVRAQVNEEAVREKILSTITTNNRKEISAERMRQTLLDLVGYSSKMTPSLTCAQVRQGKADAAQTISISDAGVSGVFRYNPGNLTSEDDGVLVLRFGNKRYERQYEGAINIKWFGAKGDSLTDDTQAFVKAMRSKAKIFIPWGKYRVTSTISVTGSNLIIEGEDGAEIFTNNQYAVFRLQDISNVTFNNLQLSSYRNTGSTVSLGVVYSNNNRLRNITFNNCSFTIPYVAVNAVKIINESDKTTDGFTFNKCRFENIGRMGIEFQNHEDGTVLSRYNNVTIRDCIFKNTGVINSGMAISISGVGTGAIIENNIFEAYGYAGIENIGCSNVTVRGNTFSNPKSGGSFSFTGSRRMYNIQILNNINQHEDKDFINFWNCENISFHNNTFYTAKYVVLRSCAKVNFVGGSIRGADRHALFIEGVSNDIRIFGTSFDNTSTTPFSVVRTYGVGVTDVKIFNSTFHKAISGASFVDNTEGAELPFLYQNTSYSSTSLSRTTTTQAVSLSGATISSSSLLIDLQYYIKHELADITADSLTSLTFSLANATNGRFATVYLRNASATPKRIIVSGAAAIGNTFIGPGDRTILSIWVYGTTDIFYSLTGTDRPLIDESITTPRTAAQMTTAFPSAVRGQQVFAPNAGVMYTRSLASTSTWKSWKVAEPGRESMAVTSGSATIPTKSALNSAYGTYMAGTIVTYPQIGTGTREYRKLLDSNTSDWVETVWATGIKSQLP
ncbi:glycosyl hydrolase family 28-related protein [Dyadobacter sp. CY343]|uniref:glycosyl hydrolase family 28-related protein n=1 Tax=Dyadobacter sp. CY343 TaxID=2907299 RepID=UPI001F2A6F08|nr:glycosyl hydrolase family 28-related protein [Dyadobacter sp. CY343]MCE7061259.1 right-handed parallel beta-helix repeat-containing protein [Dyadobacter sp. CY343]